MTETAESGLDGEYEPVGEYVAREVTGDEKIYYWSVAERFWPHFPEYRRLAQGRDIPIMILEPSPHT
ncbi:nitroreductase/quinone reductase family protein [Nocardia coffeae]|uniref:nitroreductase/quinone reductase family protein n=1 Tax=Nocardia coffeae TaxID=2873381 RepID=UPI001F331502|nr:nitroreductase/quinone reductase family protein [Nocardia coffeae]